MEMTRKVLYKNDLKYLHPSNLQDNIDIFIEFIRSQNYQSIKTKYVVKHIAGLKGEIDILADDIIYEIKASQYFEISKENLLQALAYASLMKTAMSHSINKIIFYNPLFGQIVTYDISNWNEAGGLVNFLVEKADEIAYKEMADEINDEGVN